MGTNGALAVSTPGPHNVPSPLEIGRTAMPRTSCILVAFALALLGSAPAAAGAPGAIDPSDLLANWANESAPEWNQSDDGELWTPVPGGVAQVGNGDSTRVSDFAFPGDFTFSGTVRAIEEAGRFDNDNLGIVFGWQDESNHYRLGWEGGGFGDTGDTFDPFLDEGASGARGLFLVIEQGGVGTALAELPTTFWAPATDYQFSLSRTGSDISFEVTQGAVVIGAGMATDTTFASGAIGIYIESQAAEFRDLVAVPEPGGAAELVLGVCLLLPFARLRHP